MNERFDKKKGKKKRNLKTVEHRIKKEVKKHSQDKQTVHRLKKGKS